MEDLNNIIKNLINYIQQLYDNISLCTAHVFY